MPGRQPDPNIGPEDQHPGAPRQGQKRRIGEDRTPGDKKPRQPVGNGQQPDEPAVFPPHN
jgi:hypothetical protein